MVSELSCLQPEEGAARIVVRMCCRVVTALCAVGVLQAQSAEKVIDAYLRASGGAKAGAQIRESTLAGSLIEGAAGKTGTRALITKSPNRYYLELIVAGERTVEAYNGMSAWGQDGEGVHTLTGAAARDAEASGRYWGGRLADLKKAKIAVQLAGRET